MSGLTHTGLASSTSRGLRADCKYCELYQRAVMAGEFEHIACVTD